MEATPAGYKEKARLEALPDDATVEDTKRREARRATADEYEEVTVPELHARMPTGSA